VQGAFTKRFFVLAVGAILLLWPLAWNRSAVLFDDTIPYLMDGRQVWFAADRAVHLFHKAKPAGAASASEAGADAVNRPHDPLGGRSPYYGAFAWGGRLMGGLGLVVVLQAAWLAGMILDAWALLGIPQAPWRLAGMAVIAVTTSLAFFVTTIMPDAFAGAVPLSICLIWFCRSRMSRWSLAFWWLSLTASMLFHTSFLIWGFALLGCLAVVYARKLRAFVPSLIISAAAFCIAVTGTAAISAVTLRITGVKITPIPFLLARTIGDGTAAKVLQQDCPQARYVTCRFVKDLPLTADEFLWRDRWVTLPVDQRAAVASEQDAIVFKALTRYPAEQFVRSTQNGIVQLGALGLGGYEKNRTLELEVGRWELSSDMAGFRTSPVWTTPAELGALAGFWKILYLAAAVLAVVGLAARKGPAAQLSAEVRSVLAWLLIAVVIGALEHGALSGVQGRYGSRVSWLPMFTLCTLTWAWIAQREYLQRIRLVWAEVEP
jgi:hypothetical protein